MPLALSEKKLHRIGRIDQIIRDYFASNPFVREIPAKDLMPLFIRKSIFTKDHRNGLPIRDLLRELDGADKLDLISHCRVERKEVNRNWYFVR